MTRKKFVPGWMLKKLDRINHQAGAEILNVQGSIYYFCVGVDKSKKDWSWGGYIDHPVNAPRIKFDILFNVKTGEIVQGGLE